MPSDISRLLYVELNRYEGISAILNESLADDDRLMLPYVTYNNFNDEKGDTMKGVPYTRLVTGSESMAMIGEWLNPRMRKILSPAYFDQIVILDANTTSEQFKLFNVLKECLSAIHRQNAIYNLIRSNNFAGLKKFLSADVTVPNVDLQSAIYGTPGKRVSMLETAIRNRNTEMTNFLLRYIKTLDVNLYISTLKRLLKKLGDEGLREKVESKLPEWYK